MSKEKEESEMTPEERLEWLRERVSVIYFVLISAVVVILARVDVG